MPRRERIDAGAVDRLDVLVADERVAERGLTVGIREEHAHHARADEVAWRAR